jgi:hypothetical protein
MKKNREDEQILAIINMCVCVYMEMSQENSM